MPRAIGVMTGTPRRWLGSQTLMLGVGLGLVNRTARMDSDKCVHGLTLAWMYARACVLGLRLWLRYGNKGLGLRT